MNTLESIFRSHWARRKLDKRFNLYLSLDEITNILLPHVSRFTASHIAALCIAIGENIEFLPDESFSKEKIIEILLNTVKEIPLPIADMEERTKSMTAWHNKLMNRSSPM